MEIKKRIKVQVPYKRLEEQPKLDEENMTPEMNWDAEKMTHEVRSDAEQTGHDKV